MSAIARICCVIGVLLGVSSSSFAGSEFQYLPDHPGKMAATVTGSHVQLKKNETVAYKRNLEQLRDLLARQPVFSSPRGVEIIGYFRPNDYQPKATDLPIPGFGYLRFHFYHQASTTGKPVRICCTTDEIFISVNNPNEGFEVYGEQGFPTKAFYEPRNVGELYGFPVYRTDSGNDVIVLSRSATPLWLPVTREEFVAAWLKRWQKQAADAPAVDTVTPELVRSHQEALAVMTPEERKMQARELRWDPFKPAMAPAGSNEGRPLVRTNPAWFNRKLSRTAFQLLMLRFSHNGDHKYEETAGARHESIAPYRVWQALHSSDWKQISGALTDN